MPKTTTRTSLLIIIAVFCWACSGRIASSNNVTPTPQTPANAELKFKVPSGWVSEHPSSNMRVGQYSLPKAEGDSEDASMVLYYFGSAQGGSVQANIDRWIDQME